ncbi:MAG TPA: HAMP domain-containing sensor histidine kinase [Bacteroidales bacterium]|nr:HAMP domain-containing sensor histidine kinase [Bacteroidales bacterium]
MKTSKNLLAIVLMSASTALLLILEILWLKNASRTENANFTRTSYFLFQNTVMALQDSLRVQTFNPVPPGRPPINKTNPSGSIHDSNKVTNNRIVQKLNDENRAHELKPEKITRLLRFVYSRFSPEKFPETFQVKITGDSVSMNRLKNQYSRELHNAGIQLTFNISVFRENNRNSGWVYSIHFYNMGKYAFKKVMPQVVFCAILTLLITLSFISLYRNIRSNQRLMELKNDFISNITHELKTPVATVSVAIEALQNFSVLNDPAKAMQYLDIASKELNRLDMMTGRILSNSVVENKGVEFKNEPVDMKRLADHVIDSMQLVFEKKKAQVKLVAEGDSFIVAGSSLHIMDVMYNLIDNALKYGQAGVRIDVDLFSDGRDIVFSVKDDGPGISPEFQKKIFEKFGRIPGGDVYKKGYGLGLYYVKQVVERHKGTIHLDSKPGKGSTFSVRLPKTNE